jgi:protein-S-isoprenylcysteine O-methyltransferase Ste14
MLQTIDPSQPMHAIYWLWVVWYASWLISLMWTTAPAARPNPIRHIPNQIATVAGVMLLFNVRWNDLPYIHLPISLWTLPAPVIWGLCAFIALAFAFCWWARIAMGKLWSGLVSRTEDHRVIDTGPFALVRHPIYSGIIVAGFATAAAQGRPLAFAGATLLLLGLWLKARMEERFLSRELGAEAYGAYRARVPMLIPFPGR